jgi:hypothetical protein
MKDGSRKASLLLFSLGLAIVPVACAAYPFYVIRPFRAQGARELAAALFVKQVGPAVSTICAVLSAAVIWFVWTRGGRWLARTAAILLAMVAVAGSYLARFNIYERIMFHPLATPQFAAADEVAVDSNDMVMAVQVKDERRAYPIREMAYHHVVNDVLAGEPIAATY